MRPQFNTHVHRRTPKHSAALRTLERFLRASVAPRCIRRGVKKSTKRTFAAPSFAWMLSSASWVRMCTFERHVCKRRNKPSEMLALIASPHDAFARSFRRVEDSKRLSIELLVRITHRPSSCSQLPILAGDDSTVWAGASSLVTL